MYTYSVLKDGRHETKDEEYEQKNKQSTAAHCKVNLRRKKHKQERM